MRVHILTQVHVHIHTHITFTHSHAHTYSHTGTNHVVHKLHFCWMQFNLQKQGSELLWTCPLNIKYIPVEWQRWVYLRVPGLLCEGPLAKENWYLREPTLQGRVIPTSALRPNPLQVSINKSTQNTLHHQKWRRLKEQGKAPPSSLLIVVTKKSWVP